MDPELEYDEARSGEILIQLESALINLDKIDAEVAAIHVDAAIVSICKKYGLSR
jgi:hypothetical protein